MLAEPPRVVSAAPASIRDYDIGVTLFDECDGNDAGEWIMGIAAANERP